MVVGNDWSKTWTFFEDAWHEGNVPIMGPRTHAAWLCSIVFDGARYFEGVAPDLELHCARVNESAAKLFLKPTVSTETWVKLAREGIARFDKDAALYIRPMYWAEKEGPWVQAHDPESTRWCLSIYEAPMRPPKGFSVTLSPLSPAYSRDNAGRCQSGMSYIPATLAHFSKYTLEASTMRLSATCWETSRSWRRPTFLWPRDGVVYTPIANGTFLAGITRQRVIGLLRTAGVTVVEKTLSYNDFKEADEIFSTGNYSKVVPVTRIDDRTLPFGPLYAKARELYWAFAHS